MIFIFYVMLASKVCDVKGTSKIVQFQKNYSNIADELYQELQKLGPKTPFFPDFAQKRRKNCFEN